MGVVRIKISWNSIYRMLNLAINIGLSYSPSSSFTSWVCFDTNK
nr:MAG TPA: hypothetical protein [Bacteriophage sp.]